MAVFHHPTTRNTWIVYTRKPLSQCKNFRDSPFSLLFPVKVNAGERNLDLSCDHYGFTQKLAASLLFLLDAIFL